MVRSGHGLRYPHDRREPCLFYIQLGPPTRPSPTRQARTMPRPCTYTGLNQVDTVTEKNGTTTKHTTNYTYDPNGNPDSRTHDTTQDTYVYNPRDLVSQVTNAASTPNTKTTSYTYTPRGQRLRETKANGNTVDYQYFLDGLLQHQLEQKPGGALVSEHTLDYDPNGNRKNDTSKTMSADNHAALIQRVQTVTYDPRDRIATLTKTDPASGATVDSESYVHDANDNVISQTITNPTRTTTTAYNYDRNRLQTAVTGGTTAAYNYDPFGRLNTITSGGQVVQRTTYDGFDRIAQQTKQNASGAGTATSRYTYDPLDRTASQTDNAGATGEKTTTFNYLGLSGDVIDEQVAGQLQRSYQYSPWGERLSQTKRNNDGTSEGRLLRLRPPHQRGDPNRHLRGHQGDVRLHRLRPERQRAVHRRRQARSRRSDQAALQLLPLHRQTVRPASGTYDLGFRDYDPGLNRFLTRDVYNGALADLDLSTDPFTNNRYTFASGNPTSMVDLDGHAPTRDNMVSANPQLNTWLNTGYAKAQAEGKGGTIRPPTTLMVAVPIKDDDRNILQRLWNGLFDVTTGYEATDHARYIAEIAKKAGVDPRTLMAVITQESGTRQRWPLVGQEEFHLTIINAQASRRRRSASAGCNTTSSPQPRRRILRSLGGR
jgi:RHS repeat-associated protein